MTPAEYYRRVASELSAKAENTTLPQLAVQWRDLANCYLRLAEQADQNSLTDIAVELGAPPKLNGET
jgi:hypothetical protein